ncbi:hypothetical protein CFP56_043362 [Quercus suber]|uniref:Uncharacterized protein n=1 Tax=Quercus suber TaxID=58331 RepID=A0AAW0LJ99_QUESU
MEDVHAGIRRSCRDYWVPQKDGIKNPLTHATWSWKQPIICGPNARQQYKWMWPDIHILCVSQYRKDDTTMTTTKAHPPPNSPRKQS